MIGPKVFSQKMEEEFPDEFQNALPSNLPEQGYGCFNFKMAPLNIKKRFHVTNSFYNQARKPHTDILSEAVNEPKQSSAIHDTFLRTDSNVPSMH